MKRNTRGKKKGVALCKISRVGPTFVTATPQPYPATHRHQLDTPAGEWLTADLNLSGRGRGLRNVLCEVWAFGFCPRGFFFFSVSGLQRFLKESPIGDRPQPQSQLIYRHTVASKYTVDGAFDSTKETARGSRTSGKSSESCQHKTRQVRALGARNHSGEVGAV